MLMVQKIRSINREIQHLVDQLFQVTEYIESGNDVLTQLLNRRYLNTIVGREISYARKHRSSLSLLALDADYFKTVNDRYGLQLLRQDKHRQE
jgi:diguanylate cyclase